MYRPDVTVMSLSDQADLRTYAAPAGEDVGERLEIAMTDLRHYGLYAIDLQGHDGRVQRRLFARNSILEEGHLSQLSEEAFARSYSKEATDRIDIIDVAATEGEQQLAGSSGMWRWFALALLIGLVLETLLAWRFGRR